MSLFRKKIPGLTSCLISAERISFYTPNGSEPKAVKIDYVEELKTLRKMLALEMSKIDTDIEISESYSSAESVCANGISNIVTEKPSKIFISHADADKAYIKLFIELLEFIGVQSDQLFCSSVPGYDVPEGEDIYEYLKQQYDSYSLHIFYMLSKNYYKSAAALNEMGAGWILQMKYTTVLLPGFEYEKIKGAVNPNKISVRLDSDRYQVRSKLKQIKMKLEEEFKLSPKPEERWDEKVDEFIEEVNKTAKEIDVEDYNKTLLTQQKYSSMFDDMIDILRIEQDGWV